MELAGTKLATLYYHELWSLANAVVKRCEEVFAGAYLVEGEHGIQCDPEVHAKIASALSSAANIKKLILIPGSRSNGENGERFKLRKERAKELNDFLADLGVSELLNHKIRNTLEHFDEYLDEANCDLTKKSQEAIVGYNLVISHWSVTDPKIYPIRIYVSSERKFYNMKWCVDLGLMHSEAQSIVDKLRGIPAFSSCEPGGVIMKV